MTKRKAKVFGEEIAQPNKQVANETRFLNRQPQNTISQKILFFIIVAMLASGAVVYFIFRNLNLKQNISAKTNNLKSTKNDYKEELRLIAKRTEKYTSYFFPDLDPIPYTDYYPTHINNIQQSLKTLASSPASLDSLLDELKLEKLEVAEIKNNNRPLLALDVTDLTKKQKDFIKLALQHSFSEIALKQLVSDPSLKIVVVPQKFFQARGFGSSGTEGMYDYDKNFVAIADHLVADTANSDKLQQLILVLSDEISMAYMRYTKLKKINQLFKQNAHLELGGSVMRDDGTLIFDYLWTNDDEYKVLDNAYNQFQNRINEYIFLAKISPNLDTSQLSLLSSYDSVMESYMPLRYGERAITDAERYIDLREAGQIPSFIQAGIKQPKSDNIQQIREWKRGCFLQQITNREYDTGKGSYYANKYKADPKLKLLEDISEFAKLSPKMQQHFGPELCKFLDKSHELDAGEYCSRAISMSM